LAGRQDRLLGNHQRSWLWGKHLVRETWEAAAWPILELHLADRLDEQIVADLQTEAKRRGVPVEIESSSRLTQLCGAKDHQGFLAKMGPFPYAGPDQLLENRSSDRLYVALDQLQDSYNFGAVIRCAEVFGVAAVIIGEQRQTPVNSQVARSSAGAVNRVPILRIPNLSNFLQTLSETGVTVWAASEKAATPIDNQNLIEPSALVIGNEGRGVTTEVERVCQGSLRIPQSGSIGSLNAAVAAGIVLYEAQRQRRVIPDRD